MKVSYPLSLKVSLWLILNLLLLAGLGVGFFVVNGGLRWDALVAGPSGDSIQTLANIIAGEAAATSADRRTSVLKRFGAARQAEFYLFNFEEGQVAGDPVKLPDAVRTRVEGRYPRPIFGDRKGSWSRGEGGRGPGGEFERYRRRDSKDTPSSQTAEKRTREFFDNTTRAPTEKAVGGTEGGRRDPPPGFGGPSGPGGPPGAPGGPIIVGDPMSGRFVFRGGTPAAYWVGLRVPFVGGERIRPVPTRLVVRVSSLWGLLHLLNLQSWLLAGTGVLVLSIVFWLPLIRSITRSIKQLTNATEQIAAGRFDTRITARRRDELGLLGESVNRMAARLDAHMTGQKRFLGDVAHELCSPLARLQMATGILAEQAPANLHGTVGDLREEVQQMSTLVNELLAFTKAGMQQREVAVQSVELAPLVREAIEREDGGSRVRSEIPEGLQALGERELLARALSNLIRNALRYAGSAGEIVVSGSQRDGKVIIAVDDEGPGVPAGDVDRLGEPFFRPELARTRESGGVGLGLAIVRTSVAACGGQVRFANRSPQGFRAEILLKEAKA